MGKAPEFSSALETRVRQSFAAQSMMTTIGGQVVSVAEGQVTIAAPILPGMMQQQGYGHGGLSFALGDTAAGYSALTMVPEGYGVLSTEMKINFLSPAAGVRLRAEGRVIKPGRRLLIVQADVYAETEGGDRHVALLTGTIIPIML
ncbi:uncharacterized domain 1-containing protein [Salinihabitans flavidus]|uniref:Medium/long-chain acyl-CoA thioesterase YigI n=1 Tax=Salinihabitans flavidus TaxID=569882 RepID=A0A1H8R5Q7_9RHOB|nr:PaaI family thioesterase [Salinihabitans flavidus]SEO61999.1 uncharacterized domain 1-containing protein [Salinihabitans flavidus]